MLESSNPEFRTTFRSGLGRALAHIRQHSTDSEVHKVVTDGLLHHRAFDPQCEGSRSEYLLEAARLLSPPLDVSALISRALRYARYSHGRHWDLQQYVDLLVLLGRNGDEVAARTLRRKYRRFSRRDSSFWEMLATGLISLDGIPGLRRVLTDQLSFRQQEKAAYHTDFLSLARHHLGEQVVTGALPGLLKSLPQLAEQFREDQERQSVRRKITREAQKPHSEAYEKTWVLIREMLAQPEPRRNFHGAFRLTRFSRRDLQRLAQDLARTDDLQTLRLLLNIFVKNGVPAALERLLELRKHGDGWVSYRAFLALARLQSPEVRRVALDLLRRPGKDRYLATELLRLNYQPGDEKFLRLGLAGLVGKGHLGELHSFLMSLTEVVAEHPDSALLTLLAESFPHQPCTLCREKIIKLLMEHHALPDWLASEARRDANLEIRQLVKAFTSANPRR